MYVPLNVHNTSEITHQNTILSSFHNIYNNSNIKYPIYNSSVGNLLSSNSIFNNVLVPASRINESNIKWYSRLVHNNESTSLLDREFLSKTSLIVAKAIPKGDDITYVYSAFK